MRAAKEQGQEGLPLDIPDTYSQSDILDIKFAYQRGVIKGDHVHLLEFASDPSSARLAAKYGSVKCMDAIGYDRITMNVYMFGALTKYNSSTITYLISKDAELCNSLFNEVSEGLSIKALQFGLNCGLMLTKETLLRLKETNSSVYAKLQEQV